ncbi:translation initiation factor 5 [Guillardia theta CCMP2712]|uniref:Translation initiation factor 5 n=1 Tax=Guillardia theta (strain CCMP2712) TaxID=905079 RepID=L1JEK6_GUITC|nr:translation initiation factor 5 [Guillardia theta CCMP2712]EKX46963.1 translation initiation factor 5 [Guillardia theta CCMP2712]|eukprot:XP_005833943.1 translation initiation factor 5 [Guillardia theta CCMP2712]
MCFDEDFAKAHFLITASLLNAPKLTDEIVKRKELLKASCKTEEQQMAFLFAMELMIVKEKRRGIKKYDDILRKLWEHDIISEDRMDTWYRKEDGLKQHYPDFQLDDAIDCRKAGWKFIDWVQQGEDEDDEEEEDA